MSITDELREWAKTLAHWWYNPVKNEYTYTTGTMPPSIDAIRLDSNINAIADRIDVEHERQLGVLYRDMSDAEWIRLPKDADGVPIHVGDVMNKGEVTCIRDCGNGWEVVLNGLYTYDAPSLHHYAPTVEDVLRELLREYDRDDSELTNGEIIEMFAKRLTLAEGEDA